MDLKNYILQLKKSGKLKYLLIILIAGIVLILAGARMSKKDADSNGSSQAVSISEYEKQLEAKIKNLCEQVDGVSDVTVALSLEGGYEYVYATDGSDDYVLVGSGNDESGMFLGQKAPKISGIGIVCAGGGDPGVQKELLSLISAACGIGTNKIFITEAQK